MQLLHKLRLKETQREDNTKEEMLRDVEYFRV